MNTARHTLPLGSSCRCAACEADRFDALAAQFTRDQVLRWTPESFGNRRDVLVRYLAQTDACETAHVRRHAPHDDTIDGTLYVARLDELTAAADVRTCDYCDKPIVSHTDAHEHCHD